MNFSKKPPRYHIFLLTLWEERSQDLAKAAVWRFRLEIPRSGERRGFATLEELMAFLEEPDTWWKQEEKAPNPKFGLATKKLS